LAQLANISIRITLYELLRFSKSIRDALREVLADVEIFMTQIFGSGEEDGNYCHHTSKQFSYITFTLEDMQVIGIMIDPFITWVY